MASPVKTNMEIAKTRKGGNKMLTMDKGWVIIDIEGTCGAGWIRIILVPAVVGKGISLG